MVELALPVDEAASLSGRERVMLFCAASCTNLQQVALSREVMTGLAIKGLISRSAVGEIALTDRGRAVLRAMMPDL